MEKIIFELEDVAKTRRYKANKDGGYPQAMKETFEGMTRKVYVYKLVEVREEQF